jgi:hypothetical protein
MCCLLLLCYWYELSLAGILVHKSDKSIVSVSVWVVPVCLCRMQYCFLCKCVVHFITINYRMHIKFI